MTDSPHTRVKERNRESVRSRVSKWVARNPKPWKLWVLDAVEAGDRHIIRGSNRED